MKTLIESAFDQVHVVGPHVMEGRFDIIGSHSAIGPNAALEKDGKIILPEVWEDFIQPGMAVAMAMWPMDQPKPEQKVSLPRVRGLNFPSPNGGRCAVHLNMGRERDK